MIVQRFNLNLIPNQSPVVVHVNQYDTGTGRLIATLYEGNEPYSPNGTAVIQGTKPDGHGFQYTATLDGNVVTADLTEQMAPVAGDVRTQIVVTESSGVTGTFAFIIRVQPSALPSDTDMSESDYQYIEEAIREAQEAVQTAQEATETAQEAVERAEAAISETQENAEDSEAWAQGTRGGIPVEPTDPTYEHNAEYWAQYAERYAQGGLHYKASIPFADIPTTGMREGDMYDITDDFTTDSRFTEGAGIKVKGGTNIAWNSDNKWDILALPYIPKTTFNGRSGSILPMAGDYDSKKILLSSILHIGGETQSDVQEALEALSDGSGHTILNGLGQEMPQRKNLRFAGANLSDDAQNDTTNVTITGGSGGSTITVTTIETTLYGETVTITDGTSTFTGVFDNSGVCVIDGVTVTGALTVSSGAASRTLNVPYFGNYTVALSFWAATINVSTDPDVVSAIVKKDGVQIDTISFSAGSGVYIADSTGAYTFTATVGGIDFTSPTVNVTQQTTYSTIIDIFNATLSISTSSSELYGKTITIKKGSTVVGTTAFSAQGSASYTVHETGTYTCECEGYSGSATVSAETSYNVTIDTIITYHLTVDIYSAASDTLSYTDDNGAQTVTTDATGKAAGVSITITQPSVGVDPTITFTSSIAKNPNNLSNNYSRSITITEGTSEIYVMPDHALYWYGYNGGVEAESNAAGWTVASSYPFIAPTFNTNSIRIASTTARSSGVGSSQQLQINKGYCIASNISGTVSIRTTPFKSNTMGTGQYDNETLTNGLNEVVNTTNGVTLSIFAYDANSVDITAMWYD